MAKIDTSRIEGYAGMSAEEKIKALEAYNVPDPDLSGYVSKEQFDRTASELATKKKELREKLTDDEAARQREQEERDAMRNELEALRRESLASKYKVRLMALGYEEALADTTAEAMVDGNVEAVFSNYEKHLSSFEKRVRAEALRSTPKPTGDGEGKTITLRDFRAMSPADRLRFSQEHPDEYKELYAGGN